jgi:hypothetical protein
MRRALSTVAIVSVVALFATVALAQDTAPSFAGTWIYAGGGGQRAKLEAAIEAATDDMNFIVAPIARSRLRDSTKVRQQLVITLDAGKISVGSEGANPAVTPNNGSAPWVNPDGDTLTVTQKVNGDKLSQTFAAGDGSRNNIYKLNKDGTALTMNVTVKSSQLTIPLTYALTYKKK